MRVQVWFSKLYRRGTPRITKEAAMEGNLIRTDRNGTQYFSSNVCRKCGGKGYLYGYEHIDGARCWRCGTRGFESKPYTWKVYTPEYAQKLADKRREKMLAQAPEENRKNFERWGFSEDGKAHIVLGDTFVIKDALKGAGAKFNDSLGWHFSQQNDRFDSFEISISDVAEKNDLNVWQMLPYSEVYAIIKEMKEALAPKSASEYIGNVGETITVAVTLVSIHTFTTHFTYYGETNYIFKFSDNDGNTIVWKTSSYQQIEEGKRYEIKGKVKEHSEYKGDKQTVLTRCKIIV
jgi:hypothetical protein